MTGSASARGSERCPALVRAARVTGSTRSLKLLEDSFMKKLLLIAVLLAIATAAFAQGGKLPYVGDAYTGTNTAVTAEDSKLGMHDILATGVGPKSVAQDRNGCVSCHAPHNANNLVASGTTPTFFSYIWAIGAPVNNYTKNEPDSYNSGTIAIDNNSFHTVACLSCHDGQSAPDVYANNNGFTNYGNYARKGYQGDLTHDHPVHAILSLKGTTAPTLAYVRLYKNGNAPNGDVWAAKGSTTAGSQYGYTECGSCHDPHKGDGGTYMFLRGPAGGVTPRYARIDLCRDCHGK